MFVLRGPEFRYEYANPAYLRIIGKAKAEVLGRKVNLLMAEPYASEHDTYLDHYKSTGEKRAIGRIRTVAGRKKNGHTFPIELSVTEVSAGQETGYCAFMRDISENVKNQRDLVENNRLATVGTMASKLLHELGNPLNGLHLSAQAFVRRIESPGQLPDSELTRRFDRILKEIKRLNSLLSEFRVGSFAWRYDFKPLRLDSVVQEALSLQRAHYLNQGILIEHHVLAELPPVLADSDKLNQVILNLCNNAAEAMPSGGKLTLQVGCDGQHAILEISDTGSGIPQGVDIWAPFVTTKKTGVGLGMVTVREIVAAHHGTIDYTSAPGKGTTFRLTLPLA